MSDEAGTPVGDWEHFLIVEAVMERYHAFRAVADHERGLKRDAQARARELLEERRGR